MMGFVGVRTAIRFALFLIPVIVIMITATVQPAAASSILPTRVLQTARQTTYPSNTMYASYVNYSPSIWEMPYYNKSGGPCAGMGYCTLETIAVYPTSGATWSSITRAGRYWNLNSSNGALISSGTLQSVSRYANGPCRYSSNCRFSSRYFYTNSSGNLREYITVGSRYWIWDANGTLLETGDPIPKWGPLCNCTLRPTGTRGRP